MGRPTAQNSAVGIRAQHLNCIREAKVRRLPPNLGSLNTSCPTYTPPTQLKMTKVYRGPCGLCNWGTVPQGDLRKMLVVIWVSTVNASSYSLKRLLSNTALVYILCSPYIVFRWFTYPYVSPYGPFRAIPTQVRTPGGAMRVDTKEASIPFT